MTTSIKARLAPLRHSARTVLVRLNREEQARRTVRRIREARSAFDPTWRRELRDEHATRVVMASSLRSDSNVIDVGAHLGEIFAIAVRIAPQGRHIAYEPIPELHERLVRQFGGQDVRCAALSDVNGTAAFTHVRGRPAVSGLRERRDLVVAGLDPRPIVVRTERLDDAIEEGYAPSLVKIDVEGAELQVLRGALRTLERHRPFVLFEHGSAANLYGTRSTDVFDLLDDVRLRVFDLEGDGPYSRAEFQETSGERIWNFLASPA